MCVTVLREAQSVASPSGGHSPSQDLVYWSGAIVPVSKVAQGIELVNQLNAFRDIFY